MNYFLICIANLCAFYLAWKIITIAIQTKQSSPFKMDTVIGSSVINLCFHKDEYSFNYTAEAVALNY